MLLHLMLMLHVLPRLSLPRDWQRRLRLRLPPTTFMLHMLPWRRLRRKLLHKLRRRLRCSGMRLLRQKLRRMLRGSRIRRWRKL